ncbi:signal peptide peptidase-like 2A isoform X4 [Amblyraja radiata]|uniref:signal peptide peptidase-like 2A isoform X4 n=1 Tax=Amblyraja radiata TaxID=386614 RepID=UPI001402E858|nr:signal peptide peptidase-like 2A isoform X4 [Amblyraja radiata]
MRAGTVLTMATVRDWPVAAILLLLLGVFQAEAQEGILRASSKETSPKIREYCIIFNAQWMPLPSTLTNATNYQLQDLTSTELCNSSDVPAEGIKDKLVVVMRGNCTFIEKARVAVGNHAKALLIASTSGLIPPKGNTSEYEQLQIPVALISYDDILSMKKVLGNQISATLYSPPMPSMDYSILIVFFIAVGTVALGSYWSGIEEPESESLSPESRSKTRRGSKNEDTANILTPVTVLFFVIIVIVMIVLLYFFYKWLVYVVIAIFSVASTISLYNCLSALVRRIPYCKCSFMCSSRRIEVRLVVLALFCITLVAVWVVFRNNDRWIWILHDCLGVAFCLNFLKTLKMPHYKSCVILLVLLLIYDVFFVFITPLFTPNHESIMVEVATGSGSGSSEKLPVVIRVPRLVPSVATLCGIPFSVLGFGDIIVPGLLVAYCRRFDVETNGYNIYFILCTIAYAVGMMLTFVVLIVMKMAQPALLYLVPCTLITCTITAITRKELRIFWTGSVYEMMTPVDAASEETTAALIEPVSENPSEI